MEWTKMEGPCQTMALVEVVLVQAVTETRPMLLVASWFLEDQMVVEEVVDLGEEDVEEQVSLSSFLVREEG